MYFILYLRDYLFKKMNKKVDWTKKAAEVAGLNVKKIRSLMEYFHETTKAEEFKLAVEELDSIRVCFNDVIITRATSPYFMKFETEITGLKVEALLNYNFESLIEQGTEDRTDSMIRKLITLCKQAWIGGSAKQRRRIQMDIVQLLSLSLQFEDAMKKATS